MVVVLGVEMDVVGGVIVAAQSGKAGGGGGAGEVGERGMIGMKRGASGSCSGDYGALALGGSWDSQWNRRVSHRKEGGAGVERDGYELRSVLSCGAGGSKASNVSSSSSAGLGRLVRSSSASCSLGFGDYGAFSASENTRALLAPLYRPTPNPVFVKPLPVLELVHI